MRYSKIGWGIKGLLCIFVGLLVFFGNTIRIEAGVKNDAYDYWKEYHIGTLGTADDRCKCGQQIDSYIYFCTRGVKATSNTRYKSIGYRVSLTVNEQVYQIDIGLGDDLTATTVSERDITHNGKQYVYSLRRVAIRDLQKKIMNAAGDSVLDLEADLIRAEYQFTYRFDSLLTIYVIGVDARKGARVIEESATGIKVDTSRGLVYTNPDSLARDIGLPASTFANFYDMNVSVVNPNPLSVTKVRVQGDGSNNVYENNGITYIRRNSHIKANYQVHSDYASPTLMPNLSLLRGKGMWQGETRVETAIGSNVSKAYSSGQGMIQNYEGAESKRQDDENLQQSVGLVLEQPDGASAILSPQGMLCYKEQILACTSAWDKEKQCDVICDGQSPQIRYQSGKIIISDKGSGMCGYQIYQAGKLLYSYSNRSRRVQDEIPITNGGTYQITAWDQVNNRVEQYELRTGATIAVEASNYEGWNPENIQFDAYISSAAYITYAELYADEYPNPIKTWNFQRQQGHVQMDPVDSRRIETREDGEHSWTIRVYGSEYMGTIVQAEKRFIVKIDQGRPVIHGFQDGWYTRDREGPKLITYDQNINSVRGEGGVSGVRSLLVYDADTRAVLGKETLTKEQEAYATYTLGLRLAAEKSRRITIVSRDRAGNIRQEQKNYKVDNMEPVIQVEEMDGQEIRDCWRQDNFKFQYDIQEGETGLYQVSMERLNLQGVSYGTSKQYYMQNRRETNYPLPSLANHTKGVIEIDREGSYLYEIQASDQAGNVGKKRVKISIDRHAPLIETGMLPIWNPKQLSVTSKELFSNANTVSGIQILRLLHIDSKGVEKEIYRAEGNGASYLYKVIPIDSLIKQKTYSYAFTEGKHNYRLVVSDRAGNVATKDITMQWDRTPPRVKIQMINANHGYNPKQIDCQAIDDLCGLASVRYEESVGDRVFLEQVVEEKDCMKLHQYLFQTQQYQTKGVRYRVMDVAGNVASGVITINWLPMQVNATLEASVDMTGVKHQYLAGQKLVLTIHTDGYLEQVKVDYDANLRRQEEAVFSRIVYQPGREREHVKRIETLLPDTLKEGDYSILVTGIRGAESKCVRVTFTVRGTIYQTIRSRLR